MQLNIVASNSTTVAQFTFVLVFKGADAPLTSSRWSGDSAGREKTASMQKAASAYAQWAAKRACSKKNKRARQSSRIVMLCGRSRNKQGEDG